MAVVHRKLRVQFDPSCVDVSTVLEPVRLEYPDLIYLGIWQCDSNVYVYAQNAERMSSTTLAKALEEHMVITNISSYATTEGDLQEEWRSKPMRGKKRAAVSADTTAVFVHPLGSESLQHITAEYVTELLQEMPGMDVFYKFGLKLYSLEQNMNFRARKKYKYVRLRCDDGWTRSDVLKEKAYEEILPILVEKTREAVDMFRDDIPPFCMMHFDIYAESILDHRDSSVPKFRKKYEVRRNKCLDNIACSVNDRVSRLSGWSGKKLKLM